MTPPIGSVRVPTPTKRTETKVQVKAPPAVVNLPAGVPDLSRAKEVPSIPRDRSITTAELLTKNLAAIARYMDKGRDKQTIERFEIILSSRDQLTTGTLKDAAVTCRRVGQRFFDMADRLYEGATSTRRGPVANPH